jgi:hypothetical protein
MILMTSTDAICAMRSLGLLAEDPRPFLLFLASHYAELRLKNGQRLLDASDWQQFFLEMVDAWKATSVSNKVVSISLVCHRCGHQHEGDRECGVDCGGGRLCRCEMEVSV